MKKILLFWILLLSLSLQAQTLRDSVSIAETVEGKQLWGKSLALDKRIVKVMPQDSFVGIVSCDTTKRGKNTEKGYLRVVNAKNMQTYWDRALDLSVSIPHCMTRYGMLVTSTMKDKNKALLTMFDMKSGKSLWTQYLHPVFINDTLDIVIGLEEIGSSHTLAYRLHDGTFLWRNDIPMTKNIGWDKAKMLDSTRLVVMGDNLNEIDIATGKMWKMKAKCGKYDTTGMLGLALANITSAVLSFGLNLSTVTVFYNLNPYRMTNLGSNVLLDTDVFYVTDRENFYCLSKDSLQLQWKYGFAKDMASTAKLMMRDGKVYMLNYGYGESLMRGRVKCGKPFLAIFDTSIGNIIKYTPLYDAKHVMYDGMLTGKGVYLAGGDKAVFLPLQDSAVHVLDWKTKENGALKVVLQQKQLYGFHGDVHKLTKIEASEDVCPMETDMKKCFLFDSNLKVLEHYELGETFRVCFEAGDVVCLQNREDSSNCWLAHRDGTPIARMKWKPNLLFLCGNHAFVVYDKSVASMEM